MHVRNVLHAARWKCRTQKWCKKSPSGHHRTTLSGYFATKARINNLKKNFLSSNIWVYLPHMSLQYSELRPTNGWDLLASLGAPLQMSTGFASWHVTARHFSSGRQPNFAALNIERHLYSAGQPSRWLLAHILVYVYTSKWLSYNSKIYCDRFIITFFQSLSYEVLKIGPQ